MPAALLVCAGGEGGMLAVQGASHESIRTMLSRVSCLPALEIASVNGPSGVTVSGPISGLADLERLLTEEQPGLRVSKLGVSHAFHSAAMDGALPTLHEACATLAFSSPQKARFISLVTGAELTTPPEAEHWVHNVRHTVQLYDGLCEIARDGRPRVLIEIGPDAVLTPLARRALLPSSEDAGAGPMNACVRGLVASMSKRRREDENLGLAEAMAAAYDAGVTLDFQVLHIVDREIEGGERLILSCHRTSTAATRNPTRIRLNLCLCHVISCPQALRAPSPSLSDLPLYPFEPTVSTPLATLTHAASSLLSTGGSEPLKPQPQERSDVDYGTTYMLEEHWLPCVEGRQAGGLPPIDTIFVCSEAIDAAAIAATKVSWLIGRERGTHHRPSKANHF